MGMLLIALQRYDVCTLEMRCKVLIHCFVLLYNKCFVGVPKSPSEHEP
jgi:hypothetical protein